MPSRPVAIVAALFALVGSAGAADLPALAPASGVPLEVVLADGKRLIDHWNASIYGKLWQDPALASLRGTFTEQLATTSVDLGFNPLDALAALRSGSLRVLGAGEGNPQKPKVAMQADLGDYAAKLFELLKSNPELAAKFTAVPVPGAAEAVVNNDDGSFIARLGTTVLLAANLAVTELKPWKPATTQADIEASVDGAKLLALIRQSLAEIDPVEAEKTIAALSRYVGDTNYQMRLVPEGILERVVSTSYNAAYLPADRGLLAKLPGTTLLSLAFGVDGKVSWKDQRHQTLTQISGPLGVKTPEEAEQQINQTLKGAGLTCTLTELMEGLRGTVLFSVGQGAPFPTITMAIPRSPAFDQVVGLAFKNLQVVPPAEGAATLLPIPNVPVPVQIGADKTHWMVTTDTQLATSWFSGNPGGWSTSAAGTLALAKSAKNAFMIGSSDTPAVLRTLFQYLGMALSQNPGLDGKDRQAIMQTFTKAAALSSTGYLTGSVEGGRTVIEDRGLVGFSGFFVVAGGMGALNAGRHRQAGGEAAIPGILKSQILPAEVQFESAAYVDQDADQVGEYGLLSELGGLRPSGDAAAGLLTLVDEELALGTKDGYAFAIFLPDGTGGTVTEPDGQDARPLVPGAANAQEKRFVAYAWPEDPTQGKRSYAITEAGVVYAAPADGEPAWNALFGGAGWDAAPTWKPLGAGAKAPKPAGKHGDF